MEPLMTADELAEYLGVPRTTLHNWRQRGIGPASIKLGRHIRYKVSDVETYVNDNTRT